MARVVRMPRVALPTTRLPSISLAEECRRLAWHCRGDERVLVAQVLEDAAAELERLRRGLERTVFKLEADARRAGLDLPLEAEIGRDALGRGDG